MAACAQKRRVHYRLRQAPSERRAELLRDVTRAALVHVPQLDVAPAGDERARRGAAVDPGADHRRRPCVGPAERLGREYGGCPGAQSRHLGGIEDGPQRSIRRVGDENEAADGR